MENSGKNWTAMSDKAIIAAIGDFIKQKRLEENKSQAQLAKDAGLNRSTIVQAEKGDSVTLMSLIQILRVLNLLHLLDIFTAENKISPLGYARMMQKKRVRAGKKRSALKSKEEPQW